MNLPGTGMAVSKMIESDAAERLIQQHAQIEHRQLAAAYRLADAAGVERPEGLPDPESRQTALQSLFRSVVSGDFAEWYAGELTDAIVETDRSIPSGWVGAGTDSELWQEQLDEWADRVREQTGMGDDDATDRELASVATRELYGIDVDVLEDEVVALDRQEEITRLVVGNIMAARALVETVAERLEAADVDLEG